MSRSDRSAPVVAAPPQYDPTRKERLKARAAGLTSTQERTVVDVAALFEEEFHAALSRVAP